MKQDIEQEFLGIYDAHADAIFRHCRFRVYSREHAEELTQETFLRAWEYLRKGTKIENMRALLYRIATNLVIDNSRKHKEEKLEDLLERSPAFEPASDGARDLEYGASFKEILREMEHLRPEERQVLTFRFVDDLDPKDIAVILKTNPNNVSVKINRAIKVLRRYANP